VFRKNEVPVCLFSNRLYQSSIGLNNWVGRGIFRRGRGDEGGAFEQAAEIFFAGVLVAAAGELGIGGGLVTDLETFEVNDADVFRAAFPNLALSQFHVRRFISLAC
jgi:hypothetical protein